jgi:hypothetical protein
LQFAVITRLPDGRQAAGIRATLSSTVLVTTSQLVLEKTGNLKAVMNAMGHGDVRSAMVYQHPAAEIIRNALNAWHISRPTVLNDNQANA